MSAWSQSQPIYQEHSLPQVLSSAAFNPSAELYTELALQPQLAGRDLEIRTLQERLEQAYRGNGSLVLVAGEAGIGKTRLTDEFQKMAVEKQSRVMVGRCVPGAPTPYLPFQDAFENALRTAPIEAKASKRLAKLAGETGLLGWLKGPEQQVASTLRPESERDRTLHSTLEFLQKLSTEHPILLVLDDLQWADSSSVQLLHFLARNIQRHRALIIGTYRPEEVQENTGEQRRHPLYDSLRLMRREGICHEIHLDALTTAETAQAIEGMLGGSIKPELVKKVESESGGNPLFIVEVVRLLRQTGLLWKDSGAWTIVQGAGIDIPSTVKEVILRRIERLSGDDRRILDCAAVIAERFDPGIIGEALNLDRLHLLERLDSIEKNFQLVRASEEQYTFNHEKVRQVCYEQVSPTRRKELHRIIGHVLEKSLPDESLYGQLSAHYCAAGDLANCVKYSLLAGQRSLQRFANDEAIRYFQNVVEGTKDADKALDFYLSALEGLGDAYVAKGLYDSAISSFQTFQKLSTNPRDKGRVLNKTAMCWFPTRKGSPSNMRKLLDLAEAQEGIEKVEAGRIKYARGQLAAYTGEFATAREFYMEALGIFEQVNATEEFARVLLDLAELEMSLGDTTSALDKAKEAGQILEGIRDPNGLMTKDMQLGDIYLHLGLAEDALRSYSRCIEMATRFGRNSALFWSHLYKGLTYESIDDLDSAKRESLKAREYALKTEAPYMQAAADAWLARVEIRLNNVEEAEKQVRSALETIRSAVETEVRSPLRPFTLMVYAELLAAKGEWAKSDEKYRECIGLLGGVYGQMYEAIARASYALALHKQGRRSEAKEQLQNAIALYEKIGNASQARRVSSLFILD